MTTKNSPLFSVGHSLEGFTVTKSLEIPELQCILHELTHESSGAHILHLGNEDPENLFCLSFRTLPYSSNGVAHILEHTVLCGSEKYPVKDPFFAMTRRSLNTFMNALTGSDFTCYPAASQVPKDFYNLLEVYLDAVFKPNLNELSFLQEGHRLEFQHSQDPKSPLEFKGIVFNEMKGALSSPNARIGETLNKYLYPDLSYGFNSGGDPEEIPSLTYAELKEFHKKFYNPSRCLFFFYGNFPLQDHLKFIAKHTLNETEKVPPLPPIPKQPRFQKPVFQQSNYPISPEENAKDKALIGWSWLTCQILEQEELLALETLETILMDTDASPLKMALLKSGFCKQANSFMDDEVNEIPWTIVLKGCDPDNADQIETLIRETLLHISKTGISLQMFENAIHQLEFHRSEITGDQAPFGLSLFMRSALLKQHGGQPESGLVIHSLFHRLRQNVLADPHYLTNLISKYLLNNPHYVRVVMTPDPLLGQKELDAEKAILTKMRATLTSEQEKHIIEKTEELANFQKGLEEQDFDVLPRVTMEDVPLKAVDYPIQREKLGSLELFHRTCFTNDIVYADLVFSLPFISESDLPYVRLFTVLFSQMGCGKRNYKENLDFLQGHTGGLGASLAFNLQAHDHTQFSPSLHIKGKALHHHADKLFTILHEMVTSVDFTDVDRLKEVIVKHYSGLESSINQNALRYAINLSASGLNLASKIANAWFGLDYFYMVRDLAGHFDEKAHALVSKLQELKQKLLCLEGAHLVLTCDAPMYDKLKRHRFYGLQDLETHPFQPWKSEYSLVPVEPQGRVISAPVAFTGKVFTTVSYVHPDAPALNIAAFLFDNLTLHISIREQGGAYGGGATSNAMSGNFYFYSYRDPHISRTLDAFEEAIQGVLDGQFEESDLEEAKLEMIQTLDAPLAPGSQGDLAYSRIREGRTLEVRQAFRDRVLALTKKDVIEAVKRQIATHYVQGAVVTFAGKEILERENAALKAKGEHLRIEGV